MKSHHIALNIFNYGEIADFYQNILGMKSTKIINLKKELADKLFGIKNDIEVYVVEKGELYFELVINPLKNNSENFSHICIFIKNRELVLTKAKNMNYNTIHVKREGNDLLFIKDKNGNSFELKEAE